MTRQIVCFQIPKLGVSLARMADHALRGYPIALVPTVSPRAVIQEVSCEALTEGVAVGMLVETARRLCPTLRLLPPDISRVQHVHHRLCTVAARYAPVWEPVRPGHLFLDLTGTTRLFGRAADTAARIEREVFQDCALAGVAGVGSNKLVAHVAASLIRPSQLCDVRPGSEHDFLAPHPSTALPWLREPDRKVTLAILTDLNLLTIGDIAETPLPALEAALGPPASLVHQWAWGIDPSPVMPPTQAPALSVCHTLTPDAIDSTCLLGWLSDLLERLCRHLRQQQRVCRRLTLVLRYSDQTDVARRCSVNPGTYWESDLRPHLTDLFTRCFQRRVRVRTLTLRAEALGPPDSQQSLFEVTRPSRPQHLALAMDRLRERFGDDIVWFGRRGRG